MKFKKSLIIILLLMALISIPISFASDVQGDIGLSQGEDNYLTINDNLDCVDDEIIDEDIALDDNILKSEDECSQYEVSYSSNLGNEDSRSQDTNQYNNDGPDLNTSFAEIEINFTDNNTIFVNASYSGNDGNGSQLKPFKSLSDAFNEFKNSSNKRNNIFLAKGTYSVSELLTSSKSLNIVGENALSTIIDGLNANQILKITGGSLVNIINLTLTKGYNERGGAVYVSSSYLNIINSIFKSNHAYKRYENRQGEGGAIYNEGGLIRIYNSTFSNNYIDGNGSKYGGAIYNNLGQLSIFNSKFTNNYLKGDWTTGGAIYNFNGFLTIFNSSISNTTLTPKYHSLGGAICNWNGRNSYIINSSISGNTINGDYAFGSAIANKGVLLEIDGSNITNNYVNAKSVANSTVYNINGIYRFANSIFSNNRIRNVTSNLLLCIEDQLIIANAFDMDSFEDLPSHYDLREENLVSSVKDQTGGTYSDNCWAFAVYAALESYLLKNENIEYDFSENNMKDAMYKNGAYGTEWVKGGNHIMAFAYLLRGSGPVNESQDPYDSSSITPHEGLPISKYITGFRYIPLKLNYLDNDQIKYAIMEYGALYTSVDSGHFKKAAGTSYSNFPSVNRHAVAIVGWDDNYSASNFGMRPPGDGAWIIKNSWGENDGQNGFYYVSYYDPTFPGVTDQFAAIAISSVDNLTEYRNIYQHDPLGNSYESIGYNSNTAWFANQFKASAYDIIKSFGLYTFGSSSYLVNITVNGVSKLVQEGNLVGAGYHTVKLNKLVDVAKGDVFKVTVRLTTPGTLFPIAIESKRSDYSTKVTAQLNQSFISPDGIHWYDIAQDTYVCKFYEDLNRIQLQQTNVCLKVYTEYADDLSISIKPNISIFTEGDLISFNIELFNNGASSGEINLTSVLDSTVSLVSYQVTRGSFNKSTMMWTLDNLNFGKKETLKLVLRFNEYKPSVKISFYAKSFFISANKNVAASYSLRYATHTQIIAKNMKALTVVKSVDGKNGKYLKVTLKDEKGNALSLRRIAFTLNKKTYYRTTNKKGVASLQINIAKAGTYKVKISFAGAFRLDKSSKTVKVYVKKQSLTLKAANRKYKSWNRNKYLTATLKNKKGKSIKNKKLTFKVNGKKYSAKTNSKGIAKVKVKLSKRKTYKFTVKFAGSNAYKAISKKAKVIIK